MFKHAASIVRKSYAEVILVWGSKSFTREHMIKKLQCGNFRAARIVTSTLDEMDIRTPKQLWHTSPYGLRKSKGFGDFSLFICMILLDHTGYDAEEWFEMHLKERKRTRPRREEERALHDHYREVASA